jgi:excisionase family DNA binding protein
MNTPFMFVKDKFEFFEALDEWEASKKIVQKRESKEVDEIYLSQRETAKFLRISLPTLIAWKKSGKLPYYQNGRKILFKKSELLEALRK